MRFSTHRSRPLLALLVLGLPLTLAAQVPNQVETTRAEKSAVAVTVYNDGLGLVRDVRTVALVPGTFTLIWRDVAAQILTQSVSLIDETDFDGLSILEQNYQYDLVDHYKLLQKYLGKRVQVWMTDDITGKQVLRDGTLLAPSVIEVGGRIYPDLPGQLVLPELPGGLISVPTLQWELDSAAGGSHELAMSYLTNGMSWQADYVAVVNAADTSLDLNGWTTIRNNSGATYDDAKLKLVAGKVNRVTPGRDGDREEGKSLRKGWTVKEDDAAGFEEKAFFEYHLYTLGRSATLKNNEQKQIALLDAMGVPATKEFVVDVPGWLNAPATKVDVQVKLNFKNSEEHHLGMPLPEGVVRVYKSDADGSMQFVGEDRIEHTPKDEPVRLFLGNAFDLTATATMTDRRSIGTNQNQTHYEIVLKNHKSTAATFIVKGHAGGEWAIKNATHGHTKRDATTFEFAVPVPADGQVSLRYQILETY